MDQELKQFANEEHVPEVLAAAFADEGTEQLLSRLAAEHELSDDQAALLDRTVRSVFTGQFDDSDISVNLVEAGGIDFDDAIAIQDTLYNELLVGLEGYLEEQRQLYLDLHPDEFTEPEPELRDIDVELAQEAVIDSGLAPEDGRLQQRLLDIAVSRIKEVRDDAETLHMLTKPTKTGGLAMAEAQANQVLAVIKSAALSREQKEKELAQQREAWLAEKKRAEQAKQERLNTLTGESAERPGPEPVVTDEEDLMLADEAEDEQEIADIKEEMDESPAPAAAAPAKKAGGQAAPLAHEKGFLTQQVDQAVSDSGFDPQNDDLKRRFRTVVEMLFRDLRDTMETRQKLELSVESGGLGLKPEKAEQVMAGLEAKVKVYRSVMSSQVAQEKKEFVAERQEKLLHADERQAAAEQKARDQMFERVTGKSADSLPTIDETAAQAVAKPEAASAPATLPTPKPVPPAEPKVIPVKAVPKAGMEPKPVVAVQPAAVPPPAPASPKAAAPPPKPEPIKSASKPDSKPAKPKPSMPAPPAEGKSVPVNLPTIDDLEEPVMLPDPEDCAVPEHKDQPSESKKPPVQKPPSAEPAAPIAKPQANKPVAANRPPAAKGPERSALDNFFGDGQAEKPAQPAGTAASAGSASPKKTPWEMEMLNKMKGSKPAGQETQPAPGKSASKPPATAPPPPPAPKPASVAPVATPKAEPPKPAAPEAAPTSDKKMVSDVKFTPKLTGPVEELKLMRLEDFRRLSKDPKEATLKIGDKVDLLQEQQFEMKTAGIKAWQDSPVNRLYLEILRKSLEGKPIQEVIKERESMGDPTLTKPEFDAIMALNRKLRFG